MVEYRQVADMIREKTRQINWLVILAVAVLSYGFVITNPSIGVDDENFDFYFKYNGIVGSGRWGSWLIRKVLDSYEYLPVWRDFLALLILILAAFLFVCIAEYSYGNKLDSIISTSVMALIISYPIVAKMFIYIDNSVETSFCLLFATVAGGLYVIKLEDRKLKTLALIGCLSFLIIGCALIENTLIYFFIEVCIFSYYKNEKRFILRFLSVAAMCVGVAIISKGIGRIVSFALDIGYHDYASGSYVRWSTIHNKEELFSCLLSIVENFKYWMTKYISVKMFGLAAVFWIAVAAYSIFRKELWNAAYAFGIIILSLALYIVTGNGGLPLRIFTAYVFVVASAIICVYRLCDRAGGFLKSALKTIFIVAVFFMIFYFSKESNEYYQTDYKRYLRDVDVARNVNCELQKEVEGVPQVPVIFLGQPNLYNDIDIEGEFAFTSIYSNNQRGESIRIHRFFSMLGYEYPDVLDEEITMRNLADRTASPLISDALAISDDMPSYPCKGYIKILDNMVIVKLGSTE